MLVPIDCILVAAQSLEPKVLSEAAEILNAEYMASVFRSGEVFIDRVIEAREQKLRALIQTFQAEPDSRKSHCQWRQIEKEVFGNAYREPSGITAEDYSAKISLRDKSTEPSAVEITSPSTSTRAGGR